MGGSSGNSEEPRDINASQQWTHSNGVGSRYMSNPKNSDGQCWTKLRDTKKNIIQVQSLTFIGHSRKECWKNCVEREDGSWLHTQRRSSVSVLNGCLCLVHSQGMSSRLPLFLPYILT